MSYPNREKLQAVLNEHIAAGRREEAADVAVRLADFVPDDDFVQRSASSLLLEVGRLEEARVHAVRAVRLRPDNWEYLVNAGFVLNICGEYTEAVRFLIPARKLAPENAELYQQLSLAVEHLKDFNLAAKLALLAFQFDPGSQPRGVNLAYAYAKNQDFVSAARTLEFVLERFGPSGSVLRALSGFLLQFGETKRALETIDEAIALEPYSAEYYIHRTSVLYKMGRWAERADDIRKALAIAPDDRTVRRHAVSVLVESGEVKEALRRAAELLSEFPDEDEYAACMRFILDARDANEISEEIGGIAALKANTPPRPLRPPPSFSDMAHTQMRVIGALVLRDIRTRYGESRIAFVWTLLEPFLHIGTLAVVFQFTMHGRPPIGDNYFHFYFTGVMPYLLFSHLIMHVGHTVKDNRYMLQIPSITPMDLVIAKAIVEVFITATIYVIFTILFMVAGVDAMPVDVLTVIAAFGITFVMGLGLGALCATLQEFGSIVEHVVGLVVRVSYFASGIFYVPAMMPDVIRQIIAWNPFLHVIDMNRIGYFQGYTPFWYEPFYAIMFSLLSIMIGTLGLMLRARQMRVHI